MRMARVKNWMEFQHYKDRSPPWIKLHRSLLDDFEFQCLPIASKALAPMLWLLAAESSDGAVRIDEAFLAFRLRWQVKDVQAGVTPLIEKGFLIVASDMLAACKQGATPETEEETEGETEIEASPLGADAPVFGAYQPIVDAYHELLPKCQAIATPAPKRLKKLANAAKLAKRVCASNGWTYEPETFWRGYFGVCANDPWMRGDVPNPNNDRWKQNLDVLLADDRLAQVIDQAIASMREAA